MEYFPLSIVFSAVLTVSLAQPPWTAMVNVKTADDFSRFVKMPDGSPLNVTNYMRSDEFRQSVSGMGDAPLAAFDSCTPRYTTVVLDQDQDPKIVFWPPCTRARRCGGCCPGQMQECSPVATEMKPITVMKTKIPFDGSPEYTFMGMEQKMVEHHTRCEPACRVKAHHCNPLQDYLPMDCRCSCRDRYSCPSNRHMWDEETCTCKCARELECSGFAIFNRQSCLCELRNGVSVISNRQGVSVELSEAELQRVYGLARSPSTTTTTTTSTTTTLPPLLFNLPGATCTPPFPCLPGMRPEIMANGRCQCVLTGTFQLPPLRRRRRETLLRRLMKLNNRD